MTISAFTDTNAYSTGDVITVTYSVNNKSTLDVNTFKLELYSILWYKVSGHSDYVGRLIAEAEAPGVKPGQECGQRQVSLKIPENVVQQSLGFWVRHYFGVKLLVGGCCATGPLCMLPINVYIPLTQPKDEPPQLPINWNPTIMPGVVAVIPDEPPMPDPLDLSIFSDLKPLPSSEKL